MKNHFLHYLEKLLHIVERNLQKYMHILWRKKRCLTAVGDVANGTGSTCVESEGIQEKSLPALNFVLSQNWSKKVKS